MTQPTIRVLQIDQNELSSFVDTIVGSPVSAGATNLDGLSDVTIDEPGNGEHLVYDGATWVNSLTLGFVTGDGLDSDAFEGSPRTIAVDSTVARRDATNSFQQANTFTAALVSNSSAAVVMNSAAPGLIFDESDAAADNQVWRIFAEGATLTFDIRNDAGSITNNWLTVGRSGATAGAIALFGTALTFNGEPVIVGGSPYAGGGGDFVDSGSPISIINPHSLAIDNTFRIYDPGLTDYVDMSHDGTDFNTTFGSPSTTADWNISGFGGAMNVNPRLDVLGQITVFDNGGTDSLAFTHDGADAFATLINTGALNVTGAHLSVETVSGGSPVLFKTVSTSTDGVLSSVKIQDAEGLDVSVGFNEMLWKLKNATMGTTDDDWRSHAGHVTISDDGSAYTWTTPASTDGVIPRGATYTLANVGAGNITVAAGSGVTLTWLDGDTGGTGSRTLAQYGVATLSKRSATIWYIWGAGIT